MSWDATVIANASPQRVESVAAFELGVNGHHIRTTTVDDFGSLRPKSCGFALGQMLGQPLKMPERGVVLMMEVVLIRPNGQLRMDYDQLMSSEKARIRIAG